MANNSQTPRIKGSLTVRAAIDTANTVGVSMDNSNLPPDELLVLMAAAATTAHRAGYMLIEQIRNTHGHEESVRCAALYAKALQQANSGPDFSFGRATEKRVPADPPSPSAGRMERLGLGGETDPPRSGPTPPPPQTPPPV